TGALCFTGVMQAGEKSKLQTLLSNLADPITVAEYQKALDALFAAPTNTLAELKPTFFRTDAAALVAVPPSNATETAKRQFIEEKFNLLMAKLLPQVRDVLSQEVVKQKIAEALKLDPNVTELLLRRYVTSPVNRGRLCSDEFLSPRFAESDPTIKPSIDLFIEQFAAFMLLHKINLVISKFKIAKAPLNLDDSKEQLKWLFEYGLAPVVGWLDLNSLPIFSSPTSNDSFKRWRRLADLFRLRDTLPKGVEALSEIFSLAYAASFDKNKLLNAVSKGFGWNQGDVTFLTGHMGLNTADDFKSE